jgi:CubicO group peptidase (beta-lactamase class C family)
MDTSKLIELCEKEVAKRTFPGAAFALGRQGEVDFGLVGAFTYEPDSSKVAKDSLFDLASVTKVMATTAAAMLLHDDGKLDLDTPLRDFFPEYAEGERRIVTVRNLLLHDSGLPAYANLSKSKTREEALAAVRGLPLKAKPGEKSVYSCISMITLMQVVEKTVGGPMDAFLRARLWEPLGMRNTMFNPPEEFRARCVPTSSEDKQRGRAVKGEVHDPAAFYCGGLSGNAGLFASVEDVSRFLMLILNKGAAGSQQIICAKTVESWTKRQSDKSTRALGWDTNAEGGISAGSKFSRSSFGHTGYTGTSVWVDPENNFFAALLTNRVFPDDKNTAHNAFRPTFHDAAFDILKG